MDGEYGLIIDSTPTLCRIWPLVVRSMNLGGHDLPTAVLTCDTVDEAKKFQVKETQNCLLQV